MKGTAETKIIVETLCPYYYRKCKLKKCNRRPSPEFAVAGFDIWMKEVNKLKDCPRAGVELSHAEYRAHQERIVK